MCSQFRYEHWVRHTLGVQLDLQYNNEEGIGWVPCTYVVVGSVGIACISIVVQFSISGFFLLPTIIVS